MDILQKFKETVSSVIPVMAIVAVLGLTAVPIGKSALLNFLFGGVLLIIGLAVFLLGVDIGIQPVGKLCGASLVQHRNLFLLLSVSFVIGFLVTAAEPDIQVFSNQVRSMYASVNKNVFVFMIAGGVGLFMVLGLVRSILRLPLNTVLWISYIAVFMLAFKCDSGFLGIAFDSGGATTGPMTVPFIMALGMGVSRVRGSSGGTNSVEESFGLTGISSVGPVFAVLLYGILLSQQTNGETAKNIIGHTSTSSNVFIKLLPASLWESFLSLAPLFLLFIAFQLFLLRLPFYRFLRMTFGLIYSFLGLVIFMLGVNGGFMPSGRLLGEILGAKAAAGSGQWMALLLCTGLMLGAVVVMAEPAVWVLTEQVESVSSGVIKRSVLLMFLSAGAALSIGMALFRSVTGFNILYILLPGYAVALLLSLFCPRLFTGIAFDSGGVASGPISSSFVLAFTLGASSSFKGNSDAFGVIALIAMMPLLSIQILGIAFEHRRKKA